MENPNKEQKQKDKNIPQISEGIEPLNDSEELDLENLEEIDGGLCFGNCTKTKTRLIEAQE